MFAILKFFSQSLFQLKNVFSDSPPQGIPRQAGASPGAVSHGGSNSTTWIVLGVGLALIAITAAVSIRLRPLWRKSESRRRG